MAKSIMIQGAGSNVGKSLIVAGLCRAFTRRGFRVAPFKPQNMSNNAAVTADGGEIGRAQALQARACGLAPHTDMNPVLLKPETDVGAQVVVQGHRLTTARARDYAKLKSTLLPRVMQSFERLCENRDLIIVEGAGSPAEVNLRQGDIANMGFADAADVPVVLVGDIDRGGVIAQMVGTHAVLPDPDRGRIEAFLINKFRGDASLFDDGLIEITTRTGWAAAGVLPWFPQAHLLPAEDASDIKTVAKDGSFKIAVPQLSRIANFDDLDPLASEPNISVIMVSAGQPLPADADLVFIPGTKSTIGDLRFFREQGWDIDLAAHIRRGGHVLGVCGGYQMLGQEIRDPDGIEGNAGVFRALGHLDITTVMHPKKRVAEIVGIDRATGAEFQGYEIHIGDTSGADCDNAWLMVGDTAEGASTLGGRVRGCYIHGLFTNDGFRQQFLASMGNSRSDFKYSATVDKTLDALADHIETHVDLELLEQIAGN